MKRSERLFILYLKALQGERSSNTCNGPAFIWRTVARTISATHGIDLTDVLGRSTKREISNARQEIMFALRQRGWSYPRIGQVLGRDHTSIIHGVRAHERRLGNVSS